MWVYVYKFLLILTHRGSESNKHSVWRNFFVSVNCIHGNLGYSKRVINKTATIETSIFALGDRIAELDRCAVN
jgi:hypothetical protein